MSILERVRKFKEIEGYTLKELEEVTGTKWRRWQNILQGQAKLCTDDIEGIIKRHGEYALWISTGKEEPSIGQISPMTAKAQELLKQNQRDG